VYGAILSKRQTRLLQKHMAQRAQLKAQILHENMRDQTKQKRSKQHFSSAKDRQRAEPQQAAVPMPSRSNPARLSAQTTTSASQSTPPTAPTADNTPQQPLEAPPETFRGFVEQQRARVADDDTDNEPLFDMSILGPSLAHSTRLPLIPLTNLFDFTNQHWLSIVRQAQESTFDKELEFYELLDLDADGEEEQIDIDDSTEQILSFA